MTAIQSVRIQIVREITLRHNTKYITMPFILNFNPKAFHSRMVETNTLCIIQCCYYSYIFLHTLNWMLLGLVNSSLLQQRSKLTSPNNNQSFTDIVNNLMPLSGI